MEEFDNVDNSSSLRPPAPERAFFRGGCGDKGVDGVHVETDTAGVTGTQKTTDDNSQITGGINTTCCTTTTQTPTPFLSFSPKTCLELLPQLTKQQLQYETAYFKTMCGPVSVFDCKPETRKSPAAISKCLTRELMPDTDKMTEQFSKIDALNKQFFILVNNAEKVVSELISGQDKELSSSDLI